MKSIILSLLLLAVSSPAIAQTLDDFYARGQKDAFLTCYLISKGYTDIDKINAMIDASVDPAQTMIFEILESHFDRYGKEAPTIQNYMKGFTESIEICAEDFNKVYGKN